MVWTLKHLNAKTDEFKSMETACNRGEDQPTSQHRGLQVKSREFFSNGINESM